MKKFIVYFQITILTILASCYSLSISALTTDSKDHIESKNIALIEDFLYPSISFSDDCSSATPLFDGVMLSGETNAGSTQDDQASCTSSGEDFSVWYVFDNSAGDIYELQIDLSGTGTPISGNVTLAAFDACSGNELGCEIGNPGSTLILNCPPAGDIYIQVASSLAGQGEFNIIATSTPKNSSCAVNDDCINATSIVLNECILEVVSDCNTNTCNEPTDFGGCGFDSEETVWFEFTIPAGVSSVEVNVDNVSSGGSPFWMLLEGSCGSLSQVGDCSELSYSVVPSTQYWLAVATSGDNGSDFDLELTAVYPPSNDYCANAIELFDGVTLEGTNMCASGNYSYCTVDGTSHQVAYSFENTTGENIDLEVLIEASNATTGIEVSEVSIALIINDCFGFAYNDFDPVCNTLGTSFSLDCIPPGDNFVLIVGSEEGQEGDFTITANVDSDKPSNDECTNPINLDLVACEVMTVNGDNTNACPENFNFGACSFDTEPVVWYSFTATAATETLELNNITATGDAFLGIFEMTGDCDNPVPVAGADCITSASGQVDLVAGNSYLIAFGSSEGEGPFSFDIVLNEPPVNDECDGQIFIDMGSTESGTTLCASPDYSDPSCPDEDFENAVWYSFTTGPNQNKVKITVTSTGISSPVTIMILDDCTGTPNQLEETICDALGETILCLEPNTTYYIQLASSEANAGDFDITIEAETDPENDNCPGAIDMGVIPADCQDTEFTGDNINACPDNYVDEGCDFSLDGLHGVWYTFTTDVGASTIDIEIDLTNVLFALYEGDCSSLTFVTGSCVTGGGSLIDFPVTPSTTYTLLVSSDVEDSFTITFTSGEAPINNLCPDALDLFDGIEGTNVCADAEFEYCSQDINTSHQVYYTYTNNTGETVDLELTINPSDLTTGIIMTGVDVAVFSDCSGTPFQGSDVFCNTLGNEFVIECIEDGETIIIVIGSVDGEEGDFNISMNENTEIHPENDECTGAFPLDYSICEWVTIEGDNTNACPEDFNFGGCSFDTEPVVWFSFVATDNATSVEFQNLLSDVGLPFLGIFEMTDDCDNVVPLFGGDCVMGDTGPIPLVGGMEYLIAFGSSNGEGPFTFDIKVNESPINDDPCADDFTPLVLTMDVPFPDDNSCATPDFTHCNFDGTNGKTLFYEYTMTADGDLEITVAGVTANGPFTIAGYEESVGCDDPSSFIDDNCTDNLLLISCLKEGDVVIILIGTSDNDGDFGEYEVTVTELYPERPENDECTGAIPFDYIPCVWVTIEGDNTNACPEEFNFGGCSFDTEPVVWFSFEASESATSVEFQNLIAEFGELFLGVFEMTDDCANVVPIAGGDCVMGDDGPFQIVGGQEYLIAVGSTNGEGPFTFDIKVNESPINDDPCADDFVPFVLDLNVPFPDDNSCATPDFTHCNFDGTNGKTLFYEYTMTQDGDLEITVAGITANGPFTIAGYEETVGCDDPSTFIDDNCTDNLLVISCLKEGDVVIILIGTSDNDGDYGEFEVTVNELYPVRPVNDECTGALPFDYIPCEWVTIEGDNTNACPEEFNFGGCSFDTEPVVWFSFVASEFATSVEFQNLLSDVGLPFLGIFEMTDDCANVVPIAGGDCVNGDDGPFPIEGGMEYLIAFGSSEGEGPFTFDIKINESPINDDPCDPDFTPFVLTLDVPFPDNNSCATPDFTHCNFDGTNGKTLFYEYTMTQDGDLQVTIEGITANGPFTIAGYEDAVGCNDPSTFITDNCADNVLVIPCLLEGDVVIILIGTSDNEGDYGDYEITVTENTPERPENDDCTDAQEIIYNDEDLCKWRGPEVNENNVDACSEYSDFGTGCNFDSEETIWFTFTTPPSTEPGSQLNLQFLEYLGTGDIFAAVFEYSEDCTDLVPISDCLQGLGPHGNVAIVEPNTTYLIGVGSNGDLGGEFDIEINITSGPPNDDPCADLTDYDLSGSVTLPDQTNLCSGPDVVFAECDASDQQNAVIYQFEIVAPYYGIEIEVVSNSSNDAPLTGTVVAGVSETNSTFCGSTTYIDVAQCQDISNAIFIFDCLPEGTYQLQISTSEENAGDFDITSTLLEKDTGCEDSDNYDYCEDAADNEIEGLVACEPMNVEGCNDGACPEDFTIGDCDFSIYPTVWYSFTTLPGATSVNITNFSGDDDGAFMVIFEGDCEHITPISDCIQNGFDELEIAVDENTTYFIAIGNSNGTGGDFYFDITVNVPKELTASPQPKDICSGDVVDILVSIVDGVSTNDIEITYSDNPFVEGENEVTLTGGSGSITDILTLADGYCSPEEVVYYANIVDDNEVCAGEELEIIVTVYPKPTLEQGMIPGECYPNTTQYDLNDYVDCWGYPGDLTFAWEDVNSGESGNTSIISFGAEDEPGLYTYSVTLTDALGCNSVNEVSFEIFEPVHFSLQGQTFCYDDEAVTICPEFDLFGTGPYTYEWQLECLGEVSDDECFTIDPVAIMSNCGEFENEWELNLIITDQNFCSFDTTVIIEITPEPQFSLFPYDPAICENADDIEVCITEENGTQLEYAEWLLAGGGTVNSYPPDFCVDLTMSGAYSVIVYDVNGCSKEYSFYVGENISEEIEIEGDNIICEGESTTLSVDGIFDTYSWSTGESTETITVSPNQSTTYNVIVSDINGCFSEGEITVEVVDLEIPSLPDSTSFCTGFSTLVNAGEGYDSYEWYLDNLNSAVIGTEQDLEISEEGLYYIVVYLSGCEAVDSIYVSEGSELSPNVFGNQSFCYGDGPTLMVATGGTFTNYIWTNIGVDPNVIVGEGSGLDSIFLDAGTYELYVDDGSCAGTKVFTIEEMDPVIIDLGDPIDICYGEETTIVGPAGYSSYEWNVGGYNDTLSNVDGGLYYLTVTDEFGCLGIDSVLVNEFPPVIPDIGDEWSICEDESFELSPGSDYSSYTWSFNGVENNAWDNLSSITVTEGGSYMVEVSNEIGCTGVDSALVVKTDQLVPVIVGDNFLCEGDVIVLSADKDYYTYSWTNQLGDLLGSGKTIEVSEAGKYFLLVTTESGCSGSDDLTVVVNAQPEVEVTDDIIFACGEDSSNGSSILDFNIFVLSSDAGEWSDTDNSGVIVNGDWSSVDFSNVKEGTYTFTFTTTGAISPCVNVSDQITVQVDECDCNELIIEDFDKLCDTDSSPLDLDSYIITQPAGLSYSGSWKISSGPGGTPLNGSLFDPSKAMPGIYYLTFELDDLGEFCELIQTAELEVVASPNVGILADYPIACQDTEAEYELFSLLDNEDPNGKWIELTNSTDNAFDPVNATFKTAGQVSGDYIFRYTLTGDAPCGDKYIDVTIKIAEKPDAYAGPDQFACFGDEVVLGGSSTAGPEYTYTWTDQLERIVSTDKYFTTSIAGQYNLVVENTITNCIDQSYVYVEIFSDYSAKIVGDVQLTDYEPGELNVELQGLDIRDVKEFVWYKDDHIYEIEHEGRIKVTEAGNYCVNVIPKGELEGQCIKVDCRLVTQRVTKEIYIPNIFTPNNDSNNDVFTVTGGKNVERVLTFSIYDRWGELVFLSADFDLNDSKANGWDGTFRGMDAITGVYVYVIEVLFTDGLGETYAGDITLIR